jgi:hypothetical protein
MQRRTILQLLGSAAVALGWRPSLARAQAAPLDSAGVSTLRAVAPAVLPSVLNTTATDRIVDDFLVWLRGYKSGADMGYGYGILRKRVTPTIAPATYQTQLVELEQGARAIGGSFTTRSIDERRTLVAQAIEAAGVKNLPGTPNGQHVVVDFMAFYFNSSEANDLCHEARIGREKCRTLAGSGKKPEALTTA